MPQIFDRSLRISELVRRELSRLIQCELKDPRVQSILISEVETTKNLACSRVYVRAIKKAGSDIDEGSIMEGLAHSAGFLRSKVGKALELKKVPELIFIFDKTAERGDRIEALLKEARK